MKEFYLGSKSNRFSHYREVDGYLHRDLLIDVEAFRSACSTADDIVCDDKLDEFDTIVRKKDDGVDDSWFICASINKGNRIEYLLVNNICNEIPTLRFDDIESAIKGLRNKPTQEAYQERFDEWEKLKDRSSWKSVYEYAAELDKRVYLT